jgi:RNA polymerase sigma-70 factor (ECF subfamily)
MTVDTAYAELRAPLHRRLMASTRDEAAAEDLVQEAFLRLELEVRAGRTPDNVAAWLQRVAGNLATSRARRQAVADRHAAALVERGHAPSPEGAAIDAEEARVLRTALDELGPIDRRALLLAAHGYRGPEIADRLGRTQGATRTLLCRARAKMRVRLDRLGYAA